jgi:hypothetical protein
LNWVFLGCFVGLRDWGFSLVYGIGDFSFGLRDWGFFVWLINQGEAFGRGFICEYEYFLPNASPFMRHPTILGLLNPELAQPNP